MRDVVIVVVLKNDLTIITGVVEVIVKGLDKLGVVLTRRLIHGVDIGQDRQKTIQLLTRGIDGTCGE